MLVLKGFIFFCFAFINFSFGASDQRIVSITLKEQVKGEKQCKMRYPNSKQKVNQVLTGNYFESIKYFECTIEYARNSIVISPRGREEYRKNSILNEKIIEYRENISEIEEKMEEYSVPIVKSSEEIITEKEITIKKSENQKVTIERKPETLQQAKEKCERKGFKEKSFDSLEAYLFEKCLSDEGFAYKAPIQTSANLPASIKAERDQKQKIKQENAAKKKASEAENKKQNVKPAKEKPASRQSSKVKKENPVITEKIAEKIETPEVIEENLVKNEALEEPLKTNKKEEEEVIIKTEVKPSEINKDITYTKKTICKIDPNGGKICNYDSRYKVQGTNPINNIENK